MIKFASLAAALTMVAVLGAVTVPVAFGQAEPDQGSRSDNSETEQAQPLVIGGTPAPITDHPWQVFLGTDRFFSGSACGGSILSANTVVTAAHCVENLIRPDRVVVVAGSTTANDWENSAWSAAADVTIHPEYGGSGFVGDLDNDIAIIELATPLPLGPTIAAIEPATPAELTAAYGGSAGFSGWGLNDPDGDPPTELLRGTATLLDDAACTAKGEAYRTRFDAAIEICTDGEASGQGVCFGDSGGPLVIEVDGTPKLAGISSWTPTESCPVDMSVYAEVPAYLEWISATSPDPIDSDATATLSGRIFEDADGDGLREEPDDVGLSGVDVRIRRYLAYEISPTDVVAELVSDAQGNFSVSGLAPGYYQVALATAPGYRQSPADVGDDDTVDSDNLGGYSERILIRGGETYDTYGAGFYPEARVNVAVFIDGDGDGLHDGSSFAEIDDARVNIVDVASDRWSGGVYFINRSESSGAAPAGSYYLEWQDELGRPLTVGGAGDDESIDSDINPFTFRSPRFTLEPGEEVTFLVGLAAEGAELLVGGDVTCDGRRNIGDALAIAQFEVGIRTAVEACPLEDPAGQIALRTGDVSSDERVNIADALAIARCAALLPNPLCPAESPAN